MNYLLQLIRRHRVLLIFLLLEGLAIGLYTATDVYLNAQVSMSVRSLTGYAHARIADVKAYFALAEQNKLLQLENERLKSYIEYKSMEPLRGGTIENAAGVRFRTIPGTVIDNSIHRQHNLFTVNCGSRCGVRVQLPVIAQGSIAGIVVAVSPNYCTAISLLNKDLRISARLAGTAHYGSLYWEGDSPYMVTLDDIPRHIQVNPGDTVETSGFSTIFPPAIPIGVVISAEERGGAFLQIRVRLLTDFQALRSVDILDDRHRAELDSLFATINAITGDQP